MRGRAGSGPVWVVVLVFLLAEGHVQGVSVVVVVVMLVLEVGGLHTCVVFECSPSAMHMIASQARAVS